MLSSSSWLLLASLVSLFASALDVASARHAGDNTLVRRHQHQHRTHKTSQSTHSNGTHGMSSNIPQVDVDMDVQKRSGDARFTFFDVGLGACGIVNKDSDFIAALDIAQWDGGSHCFEKIQVNYNGKSTEATITDMCPSCPPEGLDLSPGLFSFFASQDLGIVYGSWSFGASGSPDAQAAQPSSSKKEDPPAQTHQAEKPTPPRPSSTHADDDDTTSSTKSHTTAHVAQPTTSTQAYTQASSQSLSTSQLSIPTLVVGSTVNVTGGVIANFGGLNVTNGNNRGMTTTRLQLPSLTIIEAAPSAPIFETTAAVLIPTSQHTPINMEAVNSAIIRMGVLINIAAKISANN